ncbi:MAG: hypothetical protein JW744_05060 [Candidatus Diapherotrites archaeon]|uniref:Uncharacterized protein n=1 Tax=Candidatus Iainarchaeum sp. TaxID=3101447 RepID=A0A938YRW8_9ARCH|nr:hypothetical protein [Candidatus Diapherotrites archaeon]
MYRTYELLGRIDIKPEIIETLVYYAGLEDGKIKTYGQTAKRFGIPIGTVKSRLANVRNAMGSVIGFKRKKPVRKAKKKK